MEGEDGLPKYCCVLLPKVPNDNRDEVEINKNLPGNDVRSSVYSLKLNKFTRDTVFFVEVRDKLAVRAPGQLTCFGGKREPGEDPLHCIRRECKEEMNWVPSDFCRAVDLYVDGQLVAWFYVAPGPTEQNEEAMVFEAARGRCGVWVRANHGNISPWHALVFQV